MELYDENPKKSELLQVTVCSRNQHIVNKIMMHACATEFDQVNLLAMLHQPLIDKNVHVV